MNLILWLKQQKYIFSKRSQKTELRQAKNIFILLNLKDYISNDFIGIENDENLISNEQELEQLLNEYYKNIL